MALTQTLTQFEACSGEFLLPTVRWPAPMKRDLFIGNIIYESDTAPWRNFAEAVAERMTGFQVTMLSFRTDPVFKEITYANRTFVLRRPILCAVFRDGEHYIVEYAPLGLRSYALSRAGAVADFAEDFSFLWKEYALAKDEELTRGAIEIKRTLLSMVATVIGA
jgi:hypothetical protein